MADHTVWFALVDRHIESVRDEFRPQVVPHRPAHDLAAPGVKDHGQEEEAGPGGDEGDIRYPQTVGARGGEIALHQILVGPSGGVLLGGSISAAPGDAVKAGLAQQSGDALPAHADTLLA